MDNKVNIVHQNPFSVSISFNVQRSHIITFEALFDTVCNALIMARGRPGTDQEMVGELNRCRRDRAMSSLEPFYLERPQSLRSIDRYF